MSALEPIHRSADFRRCFGCGPDNADGLRLEFLRDPAAGRVEARFTPPGHGAGFGRMLHGGLIATALDEAMGWALWGLAQRLGVTRELSVRFERPIFVGKEHRVLGWVEGLAAEEAALRAEVRDLRDRVAASARATFAFVPESRVRDLGSEGARA